MKYYIATPIETNAVYNKTELLEFAEIIAQEYESQGIEIHRPWKVHIPNAWALSNEDWGYEVFRRDVEAIQSCDAVIAISYGRNATSAGTSWEVGYAYGLNKKVIVRAHPSVNVESIMLRFGNTEYIKNTPIEVK